MARKRKQTSEAPELPANLSSIVERAEANSKPEPTEEASKVYPHLWETLSPMRVAEPKAASEGRTKMVLREPLLMVSWDRGNGCFKWVVTDKVLKFSLSGVLTDLTALASEIEEQIVSGKAAYKSLETD